MQFDCIKKVFLVHSETLSHMLNTFSSENGINHAVSALLFNDAGRKWHVTQDKMMFSPAKYGTIIWCLNSYAHCWQQTWPRILIKNSVSKQFYCAKPVQVLYIFLKLCLYRVVVSEKTDNLVLRSPLCPTNF